MYLLSEVSGQALWSTADIFNHISAALLGNTLITCQVVSQGGFCLMIYILRLFIL